MSAKAFRADVKAMDRQTAENVTADICEVLRKGYTSIVPLIVRAYRGRAWQALDFTSWEEYCAEKFTADGMLRLPDVMLCELAGEGLSARAIAAATGRSKSDVHRTTRGAERPDNVVSLDGRRRPARSDASSRAAHPAGKARSDATPAKGLPAWEIVTAFIADNGPASWLAVTDGLGWRDSKTTGALSEASRRGAIRATKIHGENVVWEAVGE